MWAFISKISSFLSKLTYIWQEAFFAIVVKDQSAYAQWMQPQFQQQIFLQNHSLMDMVQPAVRGAWWGFPCNSHCQLLWHGTEPTCNFWVGKQRGKQRENPSKPRGESPVRMATPSVPWTADEAGMLKSNARQGTEKKFGTSQSWKGTWVVASGKTVKWKKLGREMKSWKWAPKGKIRQGGVEGNEMWK